MIEIIWLMALSLLGVAVGLIISIGTAALVLGFISVMALLKGEMEIHNGDQMQQD